MTADQPTSDSLRIDAMDLRPAEVSKIKKARIPAVYDGYRYEDTYELTRFVNDVNRQHTEVLMEYSAAGKLKAKYTYGLDRLTTSNAAASGVRGQAIWASYIMGGDGSVSSLMAGSSILVSYSYSPFGETVATAMLKSGKAAAYRIEESFYGYNKESFDPLTGLQYLRARYYDPQMGRFHVADTYLGMLSDPLSQNLYSYCKNDPISYIDPSGHAAAREAEYMSKIYLVMVPVNSNLTYACNCVRTGNFGYAQSAYKATIKLVGIYTYQWGARIRLNADGTGGYPKVGPNAGTPLMGAVNIPTYTAKTAEAMAKKINKIYCTTAEKVKSGGFATFLTEVQLAEGIFSKSDWAYLATRIGIFEDPKTGIYSSLPNALQPAFGWSEGFEILHTFFTNGQYISDEFKATIKNQYGLDEDIIFIIWAGNYLNLGAGAEIGSYSQTGFQPNDYGMGRKFDMSISLSTTIDGNTYNVFEQGFQDTRWNNGFLPIYQNPEKTSLTATGTVKFDERDIDIYNAFVKELSVKEGVTIDPFTRSISFTIRGEV